MEYTFTTIKKIFREQLAGIYPIREIDSLLFLVAEKLGNLSRLECIANPEAKIPFSVYKQMVEVAERLKSHEPVQYILGDTEFYGMPFMVSPQVLIPRPETEELVQWVINDFKSQQVQILDVGTGSGCIAISLAKALPNSGVYALDISKGALQVAQQNARLNNVIVNFFEYDLLKDAGNFKEPMFDVVVSNPPYIRESEKKRMRPNVLNFEPATALFVPDDDPLVFYRTIALQAKKWLQLNGVLYFEINEGLETDMVTLLENMDYSQVEARHDLQGKPRMIKAINK